MWKNLWPKMDSTHQKGVCDNLCKVYISFIISLFTAGFYSKLYALYIYIYINIYIYIERERQGGGNQRQGNRERYIYRERQRA